MDITIHLGCLHQVQIFRVLPEISERSFELPSRFDQFMSWIPVDLYFMSPQKTATCGHMILLLDGQMASLQWAKLVLTSSDLMVGMILAGDRWPVLSNSLLICHLSSQAGKDLFYLGQPAHLVHSKVYQLYQLSK